MTQPLSATAVASFAHAVFSQGPPEVVEAYSAYGADPRQFLSPTEICDYAQEQRSAPSRSVHLAIHYPDTAGRLARKRIELNPAKCDGYAYRFTHEGWGLLWVHLHLAGASSLGSFVSANSQRRAEKWAATHPELDAPDTWVWPAVAKHLRRLTRALKQSSN